MICLCAALRTFSFFLLFSSFFFIFFSSFLPSFFLSLQQKTQLPTKIQGQALTKFPTTTTPSSLFQGRTSLPSTCIYRAGRLCPPRTITNKSLHAYLTFFPSVCRSSCSLFFLLLHFHLLEPWPANTFSVFTILTDSPTSAQRHLPDVETLSAQQRKKKKKKQETHYSAAGKLISKPRIHHRTSAPNTRSSFLGSESVPDTALHFPFLSNLCCLHHTI